MPLVRLHDWTPNTPLGFINDELDQLLTAANAPPPDLSPYVVRAGDTGLGSMTFLGTATLSMGSAFGTRFYLFGTGYGLGINSNEFTAFLTDSGSLRLRENGIVGGAVRFEVTPTDVLYRSVSLLPVPPPVFLRAGEGYLDGPVLAPTGPAALVQFPGNATSNWYLAGRVPSSWRGKSVRVTLKTLASNSASNAGMQLFANSVPVGGQLNAFKLSSVALAVSLSGTVGLARSNAFGTTLSIGSTDDVWAVRVVRSDTVNVVLNVVGVLLEVV